MPLKPTRRAHPNDLGEIVKECVDCEVILPVSSFGKNAAQRTFDGLSPQCKPCRNKKRRSTLAMSDEAKARWYRQSEDSRLRRTYGLTADDVDRMREARSFKCDICARVCDGLHIASLHVDHCHVTGIVRGMLCNGCNRGLGHFRDDIARLRAAADYLEFAARKKSA